MLHLRTALIALALAVPGAALAAPLRSLIGRRI